MSLYAAGSARGGLRRGLWLASVSILCLSMAACTLRPKPMSLEENVTRAAGDRSIIDRGYVPIEGALSLPEALARAIKYNYDVQLAKMDVRLQDKQLDLALAAMLPRLTSDAGFNDRSDKNAAESIDVRTGERSLDYSYSEEQSHFTGDLQFSWNVLDVGISYFQARQQGYRALMAQERRRKTIDGIVKSVTDTYWRAASANRILPLLDPMLSEAEHILSASRLAGERNLAAPAQLLEFQQAMIQVIGELHRMKTDLVAANIQLAALVNAAPGQTLVLSTSPTEVHPDITDHRALEDAALAMRPELRIEGYQEKVDRQDIYKEIVKMLPGFGILADGNFDSNNLLYRGIWGEVGARATFNLMNVITGPKAISAAEKTVEITKLRRVALSVAILTQVNLSDQEYLSALDSLRTAEQVAVVGRQISRTSDNATLAGAQSESDRVRHQLTAMVTTYERDKAMAQVQNALANVYSSVGVDLVPLNADLNDLPTLTRQVSSTLDGWAHGELPHMPVPSVPTAAVQASTPVLPGYAAQ
jgi:outer membrane protein TolC